MASDDLSLSCGQDICMDHGAVAAKLEQGARGYHRVERPTVSQQRCSGSISVSFHVLHQFHYTDKIENVYLLQQNWYSFRVRIEIGPNNTHGSVL